MQAIPPSTIHRRTRSTLHLTLHLLLLASLVLATPTFADIEVISRVSPHDPSTWDYMTRVDVSGSVAITDGSAVYSRDLNIDADEWDTGLVTVDGVGSVWECGGWLTVGYVYGHGELAITNGGTVSGAWRTEVAFPEDSMGTVTVDGEGSVLSSMLLWVGPFGDGTVNISNGGRVEVGETMVLSYGGAGAIHFDGGTLATQELLVGENQMTGVGTVFTEGIVIDTDVVIDSPESLVQTVVYDDLPGQSITVNLDMRDRLGCLGAGYDGEGTLTIRNGMAMRSSRGEIGYHSGSRGTVTVEGEGSTWVVRSLRLGARDMGYGALHVLDGGSVDVDGRTSLGWDGGDSEIFLDGGVFTTESLLAGGDQLIGVGDVYTHGIIVDTDVTIADPAELSQTLVYDDLPGQNVAIHLDIDGQSDLGAGYRTAGSLSIVNGVQVASGTGNIGCHAGAVGEVMVDGAGSLWQVGEDIHLEIFHIGREGSGTLTISNGGRVMSDTPCVLGYSEGATGHVIVDGMGSALMTNDGLAIGRYGHGVIEIINGGWLGTKYAFTIDEFMEGDSFINMATGGTLALYGQVDGSLAEFFGRIGGTDEIRYWDVVAGDWAHLSNATYGEDYTLEYLMEGEFSGYTALTVGRAIGDVDGDRTIGASDIDAISAAIRNGVSTPEFDLDGDGQVTTADRTLLIEHLVSTPFGSGTAVADFDLDGMVGLLDLAILGDGYHLGNGWSTGDADGDGIVGLLDLAHLGENYNFDGTGIPEPMMLSLLAAGAVGLLRRRHEILNTRERGATFPALRRILIRGQRSGGALPATTSPDIQTWG
jgi:T5SS/PEP-CTERM-associated repeat protein